MSVAGRTTETARPLQRGRYAQGEAFEVTIVRQPRAGPPIPGAWRPRSRRMGAVPALVREPTPARHLSPAQRCVASAQADGVIQDELDNLTIHEWLAAQSGSHATKLARDRQVRNGSES